MRDLESICYELERVNLEIERLEYNRKARVYSRTIKDKIKKRNKLYWSKNRQKINENRRQKKMMSKDNNQNSITSTLICKKCGGETKPSKGYGNAYTEPSESGLVTVLLGKGNLIDCLKCVQCGHSFVPKNP